MTGHRRPYWIPALLAALALASPAAAECDRIFDCELVWSDEFDGTSLDLRKWEPQIGDGTSVGLPAGWGNNELQYYQAENATVADGVLTITAKEEQVNGYPYTSARLRTRGKGDWRYGRMEMRARMPVGQGLWPAFWMLPTVPGIYGTWAASGEIDIVEYLGNDPKRVFGTLHYGAPWPNNTFTSNEYVLGKGSFDKEFHVFAVEWERGEIRWYVDDVHYATQTEWRSSGGPFPAPFDADFHILVNLAVGGNLPGRPDNSTSFPQELVVDYVRVYQSAAAKGAQSGTTDLAYAKPTSMKKIEASLTMSFANQAQAKDRPQNPRRVWCAVSARAKRGATAPRGELELRLTGIEPAPWQSRPLRAELGADGPALFAEDEIGALVDEAAAAGATIRDLEVTFDGGKGPKVTELTLDCMQSPVGS